MKLKENKIWILLFVILFILHVELYSVELKTVSVLLVSSLLLITIKFKINKPDFEILSVLILILGIGAVISIFYNNSLYNFIRDFIYFLKPILLILIGYSFSKKINNWKIIFKTIIYLGVFYSVYHISHTLIYTELLTATVSEIRTINGLTNIIEIFSIALIILGLKFQKFAVIKKSSSYFFLILFTISFTFYFSRTLLVGLLFLILGVLNYLKLNKKGLKYLSIIFLFLIGFYVYLFNNDFDRKGGAFDSFMYKLKLAPSEIFSPKLDLNNHKDLWEHWRAYEAYCAIQNLNENKVSYFLGKGFGSLVDLKFKAPISDGSSLRYIPIIHNGYVLILFKTGIIGLLLYIYFLFSLYFQSYTKIYNEEHLIFSNLLSATALYLIFSSLIITGLYNLQEETAIFLGIFLFLKTKSKQ